MPVPSWLVPFSQQVREAIVPVLDRPGRRVACFDADGTLWSEDIGEALFRWLIAGALLPHVDCSQDVYAEYEERVRQDRVAGYAWAAQCMKGLAEADVVRWSRQMAAAWPNYRPAMKGLVAGLAAAGVECWIVSASNEWVVRAAAPVIGIEPGRCIGIRVEVEAGVLTDRVVLPVICHAGKVQAVRARVGKDPDLAAGDGMGDLEMMETAAHAFAVGRADKPGAPLVAAAAARGWPVQVFGAF